METEPGQDGRAARLAWEHAAAGYLAVAYLVAHGAARVTPAAAYPTPGRASMSHIESMPSRVFNSSNWRK